MDITRLIHRLTATFIFLSYLCAALPSGPAEVPSIDTVYKEPAVPIGHTSTPFSSTDGVYFSIGGKVQRFAGTNAYWLPFLQNLSDVDLAFEKMSQAGLKVARVWGFNDTIYDTGNETVFFQLFNTSGAYPNFGANGLQRLDYVVSSAETHGMQLIVPFVNNWDDSFGGYDAYNYWNHSTSIWYQNDQLQTFYQNYVTLLVNRYKASPAIFSWQLANEPQCYECAGGLEPMSTWVNKTAALIKQLDPKHMVSIGDQGIFANDLGQVPQGTEGPGQFLWDGSYGDDFWNNLLNNEGIDFATFHLWPSNWGTSNYTWGHDWIVQHDPGLYPTVKKPVILEEYGPNNPAYAHNKLNIDGPWQSTVVNETKIAADLSWQFGFTLGNGEPLNFYDPSTIWTNDTEYATLVTQHAADMLASPVGP